MEENVKPIILTHLRSHQPFDLLQKKVDQLIDSPENQQFRHYIAAPLSHISELSTHFKDKDVTIGSDAMLSVADGSFTASIAGRILIEAGAKFVMIGSIDEKKNYATPNSEINKKLTSALNSGLIPLLCLTQTEEEFRTEKPKELLVNQLKEIISGIDEEKLSTLHIVYDAPWIVSTPWEAKNDLLLEGYNSFKESIHDTFSAKTAKTLNLIYSVPIFSHELSKIISSMPAAGYCRGVE